MKKTQIYALSALMVLSISACGAPVTPVGPRALVAANVAANVSAQASGPVMPPVHLRIKRAEIEVATQELNKQFKSILELSNEKRLLQTVLSPLEGNALQLVGKVKPFAYSPEIPFRVTGKLSARPGNVLRFSPTDIRVVGIPFKGMMDILGIELANLAKFKDRWGRVVQAGNDIDLVIEKFTNDAVIEGQIKEARTAASGVTVIF
ncbi:MAG: hypothetical protein CVV27_10435 [Candidatus Melainabacteria bacterium HGW-Melainabacteria-1]|nr:MAG: hypothetical protein CVV27_10435 [Candidatus Melainabacteria bacterium HGW-Melainabacteria-1]